MEKPNLNYKSICELIHSKTRRNKFLQLYVLSNCLFYENKIGSLSKDSRENLLIIRYAYKDMCIPYWKYNNVESQACEERYNEGFNLCTDAYCRLIDGHAFREIYGLTGMKPTPLPTSLQEDGSDYYDYFDIEETSEEVIANFYLFCLFASKIAHNAVVSMEPSNASICSTAHLLHSFVQAFDEMDLDKCLIILDTLRIPYYRVDIIDIRDNLERLLPISSGSKQNEA